MTIQKKSPTWHLRLNPFALPSDTDYLFILLIVVLFCTSFYVYSMTYYAVPLNAKFVSINYQFYDNVVLGHPGNSYADFNAKMEAYQHYIVPMERFQAMWSLSCVVIEFCVAFIVFWFIPARMIRRGRFAFLQQSAETQDLMLYLEGLCREMQLARFPSFVFNAANDNVQALAFGRPGSYYILLSNGLISGKFDTDRPSFRAIVLHELAHIRNRDINKTYFMVALYQTFIALVIVPLALLCPVVYFTPQGFHFFLQPYLSGLFLNFSWRLVLLVVLLYLLRNAVLQAREKYADARVAVIDGQSEPLVRSLEMLYASMKRSWLPFLRVHPGLVERCQTILDLRRLFRVRFWDAFFTGFVAMTAFPLLVSYFLLFHPFGVSGESIEGVYLIGGSNEFLFSSTQISFLGGGFVCALFLAGFFVQNVWRATLLQWINGIPQHTALQLGVGATLGIVIAQIFTFQNLFVRNYISNFPFYVVFGMILGTLLMLCLIILVYWVSVCAVAWLKVAAQHSSPLVLYALSIIITAIELAVILAVFYLIWFLASGNAYTMTFSGILALFGDVSSNFSVIIQSPYIVVAGIGLWCYPLIAQCWRRASSSVPAFYWAILNPPLQRLRFFWFTHLRLGLVLSVSSFCALAFAIEVFLLRFEMPFVIPHAIRVTGQFSFLSFYSLTILAMFFLVACAVVVAIQVTCLKLEQALLAVFLAGSSITGIIFGINVLVGGPLDFLFLWTTCSTILNGGTLMAMGVIFLLGPRNEMPSIFIVQDRLSDAGVVAVQQPRVDVSIANILLIILLLLTIIIIVSICFTAVMTFLSADNSFIVFAIF